LCNLFLGFRDIGVSLGTRGVLSGQLYSLGVGTQQLPSPPQLGCALREGKSRLRKPGELDRSQYKIQTQWRNRQDSATYRWPEGLPGRLRESRCRRLGYGLGSLLRNIHLLL